MKYPMPKKGMPVYFTLRVGRLGPAVLEAGAMQPPQGGKSFPPGVVQADTDYLLKARLHAGARSRDNPTTPQHLLATPRSLLWTSTHGVRGPKPCTVADVPPAVYPGFAVCFRCWLSCLSLQSLHLRVA